MITSAFVFDHRNRTPKDKEGAIELRLTIDRKPYYISTGVRVLKRHFQFGLVVDRYDCDQLNRRLMIIKKKIEDTVNDCIEKNKNFNLSSIKKDILNFNNDERENDSFLLWFRYQIPLLPVSEQTQAHYYTLWYVLKDFGKIDKWEDISVENIFIFDAWLHARRKKQTQAQITLNIEGDYLEQSTIYNYHKHLKAILRRAYEMEKIKSIPYDKIKGKIKRCEKENVEYLTEEQMTKLINSTPLEGTTIALAKDLFVIQMFTGLGYSDLQKLNLKNYKLVNDKWIYNGERVKTGVPFVSQLLTPVVEVFKKHNWNVPKLSLQKYNQNLKIIGKSLGFGINMHSHLARHTFATYMLRNGVKIENLSKMLGHTNIKQTQRYAKILAISVHEDFSMIETKIDNLTK